MIMLGKNTEATKRMTISDVSLYNFLVGPNAQNEIQCTTLNHIKEWPTDKGNKRTIIFYLVTFI